MITPDPGVYNISASPTDNSNQSDQGKMTVIGIEKLQLKQDTGNWEDAEEKYVAYVGDNLQIKALIAPSGVTWPSDIPTWQGNFSDTSLSDTRIVDTSQTDEFTITGPTKNQLQDAQKRPVRCVDTILPVHFRLLIANTFLNLVGFSCIR